MAADGIAARQLEAYLAEHQLAEGRTAWTGPSVLSYRAWIRSLWAEHYSHDERQLLTPGQVRGLWRRIVERSPVSDRLIGSHNVVQWAIEAAHIAASTWASPTKRANALAEPTLRGKHLMHSVEAELNGKKVMWLHFAYKK